MEVISSVVAGVDGVAGTGVVHLKEEPARRGPESSRSLVRTAACQDGHCSTSVWVLKTVLSGASIRTSDR